MRFLKEQDIDKFAEFVAKDVGREFFAHHDFEVDRADVEEYETEADDKENGNESLLTSISIDFAITNNDYDEDGWIKVSRGCLKTFYQEDFERFYKEVVA
jgi:hypothetical protein